LVGGSGSQVFWQAAAIECEAAIAQSIAKPLAQLFKRAFGSTDFPEPRALCRQVPGAESQFALHNVERIRSDKGQESIPALERSPQVVSQKVAHA
jgi:hypothetical protein